MAGQSELMFSNGARVGRRIAVYGPTGSGKSTLARALSERLALAHVELDAVFHRPGWEPTPKDEFQASVGGILASNEAGWVVDGNYQGVRDIVLARADTAIWLRLPFWRVYPRLVRRTIRRVVRRELLWGTNRERWRDVLWKDSMLVWGIRHWRRHHEGMRASLAARPPGLRLIVLRSPAEVRALLDGAGRDRLD